LSGKKLDKNLKGGIRGYFPFVFLNRPEKPRGPKEKFPISSFDLKKAEEIV
jgi:hypothetical protein